MEMIGEVWWIGLGESRMGRVLTYRLVLGTAKTNMPGDPEENSAVTVDLLGR